MIVWLLFLWVTGAQAGVHTAFDVRARTMPRATNFWGTVAYEDKLWGEPSREKPLFGYYRLGARGGGSPSYAGFFQVAPVAPLIFEVERSYTHRFIKMATIDCHQAECLGRVERTDFNVWLLAGNKNFVFIGNALLRELNTEDRGRLVGLEMELFTVTPGFHRYVETSGFLGYRLPDDRMIGLLSTHAHLTEDHRRSSSNYLIYRFPYTKYTISVGAGTFETDQPGLDGFSAIFGMTRSWGERISLF